MCCRQFQLNLDSREPLGHLRLRCNAPLDFLGTLRSAAGPCKDASGFNSDRKNERERNFPIDHLEILCYKILTLGLGGA